MKRDCLRREVIEELIRASGGEHIVSLSHLCCALGEDRVAVRRVMEHLRRVGAVTVFARYSRPDLGRGRPIQEILYRPKDGLEQLLAPQRRDETGWDRMWRAIRALSKSQPTFSRRELAILAGVSPENAKYFTKLLRRKGYLRQRRKGAWELVKDPGPERPVSGRWRRG